MLKITEEDLNANAKLCVQDTLNNLIWHSVEKVSICVSKKFITLL